MIANPLTGPNGTNGATQVLTGLAGGENLFIWNGAGYYAYSFNGAGVGTGLGFPSDWTDLNGGIAGSIPGDVYDSNNQVYWTQPPQLKQGQGAFIQNGATTETNTFVGTVVLSNTVPIAGGNQLILVASSVPIGGSLQNTNINLPFTGGENIFIWNGHGYYAYSFNGTGVGTGLGFPSDYTDLNGGIAGSIPGDVYDSNNQVYWTQPPSVNVGVGFFIQNGGSPESWQQNLVIP